MKHAATTAAQRGALLLQCPECTEEVRVSRDELVEGAPIACGHCAMEAELTREFDDATGKTRWILVAPLDDYADEFGP